METVYKGAGHILVECHNGISIEYMGRLILVILYKQGTKPILRDEGIKIDNRSGLDGELIVTEVSYRINKRGITILSVTTYDGIARQLKILPRVKGDFEIVALTNKEKGSVINVNTTRISNIKA